MSDRGPASLDALWHELVTAGLLGTDRRDPPVSPAGPIADVVDDLVPPDPAARMLATVATVAAARRAAFVALAPAPPLQPPPIDTRPLVGVVASATWRTVVRDWPVLEDEWMLAAIASGRRLAPDVLVEALVRHRNDAVRRARIALAGGPVTAWLVDHVPRLAATGARTVPAEAVAELPELAMPPDLAELVGLDAHTFVRRVVPRFESGEFAAAHRPVLVHLFARCRPEVLPDVADALTQVGSGMAFAMADLCRLRARMLAELAHD